VRNITFISQNRNIFPPRRLVSADLAIL